MEKERAARLIGERCGGSPSPGTLIIPSASDHPSSFPRGGTTRRTSSRALWVQTAPRDITQIRRKLCIIDCGRRHGCHGTVTPLLVTLLPVHRVVFETLTGQTQQCIFIFHCLVCLRAIALDFAESKVCYWKLCLSGGPVPFSFKPHDSNHRWVTS